MNKKFISITKSIAIALVAGGAMMAASAFAAPTASPSASNAATNVVLSTNATNQIKTGALGIGATNQSAFAAATSLGYKIVTDGGASLGPTAVFGNFTATGPSISFPGIANKSGGLCTDSMGKLVGCGETIGKTCGLSNNDATTKGCPAGSALVQMSANGATATCRWMDPSHAGGTTVPNTKEMCY